MKALADPAGDGRVRIAEANEAYVNVPGQRAT